MIAVDRIPIVFPLKWFCIAYSAEKMIGHFALSYPAQPVPVLRLHTIFKNFNLQVSQPRMFF